MGWRLNARLTANPQSIPRIGIRQTRPTAYKPTSSTAANPPRSDWVDWPGVEMASEVTIAPTWWLASLGLNRENLWETELKECRVSLRVPKAKILGAAFLDLAESESKVGVGMSKSAIRMHTTPTIVYFSDDCEVPYMSLSDAKGLGILRI